MSVQTTAAVSQPQTPSTAVPDMSIILVGWNNKAYLEPCLESLYASDLGCSYDVIVVDQGSTDGSQEMLREKYPDIRIIQNDKNVGLAKACNQGIEATHGRHALLLNNDTLVNETLGELVRFLDENPQAGAVGELAYQADQFGGAAFVDLLCAVHRQHELVGIPVTEQVDRRRDQESDHGAARAADQVANAHEQRGQTGKQDGGTQKVHRFLRGAGMLARPSADRKRMGSGNGACKMRRPAASRAVLQRGRCGFGLAQTAVMRTRRRGYDVAERYN